MGQLQAVSNGRPVFQTAETDGELILGRGGLIANFECSDVAKRTSFGSEL